MFILFVSILVIALLSFIAIFYFLIRKKKYGKKPIFISLILFVVLAAISIPLGQQKGYSKEEYKDQASTYSFDKYVNESVEIGIPVKIEGDVVSLEDNAIGEDELFLLDTVEGVFYVKNGTGEVIRHGEVLTVYGGYVGNGDNDSPSVNAQYIDR